MMRKITSIVSLLLLFNFCMPMYAYKKGDVLYAKVDLLRMRDQAGLDGKKVATLREFREMHYEGEQSDFTTEIELRGVKYNEPWLKVKYSGIVGWVYGGAVSNDPEELMKNVFSEDLQKQILSHNKYFDKNVKESSDIKELMEHLTGYLVPKLHDEKEKYMLNWSSSHKSQYDVANLLWLQDYIKGLRLHHVAEGTNYDFFLNYGHFVPLAKMTPDTDDDAFLEFQKVLFPYGHIHSYFYGWFEQTWDYGGESLLGSGKHLEILTLMYKNLEESSLFGEYYLDTHQKLIEDICQKEWGEREVFRYNKEKRIAEVKEILKLEGLSRKDSEQLKAAMEAW